MLKRAQKAQFQYSSQSGLKAENPLNYSTESATVFLEKKPSDPVHETQICVAQTEMVERFKTIFQQIILKEEELDLSKQKLHEVRKDRNIPEDLFMSMMEHSTHSKKSVLFEDFKGFLLKRLKIQVKDPNVLIDVFTSFDHSKECKLSMQDLQGMLMPSLSMKRQTIAAKTGLKQQADEQDHSRLVIDRTRKVFEALIDLFASFNDIRFAIRQDEVELGAAFGQLDRYNRGFLTVYDLQRLACSPSETCPDNSSRTDLLLKRIDQDGDGKLNYKDFYMFFSN